MTANTSFATTTQILKSFITKQTITNDVITSEFDNSEYLINALLPIQILRNEDTKRTAIYMSQSSTEVDGYLTSTDWNTFNNKVSSLTPGTNINISGTSTIPIVNLSISSDIDMTNHNINKLNYINYDTNEIDIRKSNLKKIYTNGANMYIKPNVSNNILYLDASNIELSGPLNMNNLDINNIQFTLFKNNVDIREGNNEPRIYTNGSNILNINPKDSGYVKIFSELHLNNRNIRNVLYIDFNGNDIDIRKGSIKRIYTSGNDMHIKAQSNTLYLDASNVNVSGYIDFSGNNVDIRQGNNEKRIYTTGNEMHINPSNVPSNTLYLDASNVSLNGNDLIIYDTSYNKIFRDPNNINNPDHYDLSMNIYNIGKSVILTIPDISCNVGSTDASYVEITPDIDALFCPRQTIIYPIIVREDTTTNTEKIKFFNDGKIQISKINNTDWVANKNIFINSQTFTYSK